MRIDRLREQNAELVAPDPPRPARDGDLLLLDIEVRVDGELRPELGSTDTRAELGAERLLAEIEAGLQGAAVGEEREVQMTFPDDYGREALRGKAAVFKLRVKQMQQKVLPDADDDFAKDLEHESLQALRADVRKRLQDAAERQAEAQLREQLVDKLVDLNPVPVPHSMVEQQERAMLAELHQLQQMLGRPLPFDEEMHGQMHARAERKIRAGLLFGAIAEQQKLTVSEEDVEVKLQEIAEQSGKHVAKVRAEYQGEQREGLHSQLLQNKLLEYLRSQATITEGVPAAAAEGTEAPPEPSAADEKKTKPKAKAQDSASKSQDSASKSKAKSGKGGRTKKAPDAGGKAEDEG